MDRFYIPIFILLGCIFPACTSAPEQYTELEPQVLDVEGSQSILIQIDHGEVLILGDEEKKVRVSGQATSLEILEYQVISKQDLILIRVSTGRQGFSAAPLQLEVHIPDRMPVKVETERASVHIEDYQGDLEVDTVSGNITLVKGAGKLTLWSNRGDITVQKSSGTISVAGNYGSLQILNVHGDTGVSTIMGNVIFDGLIQGDDLTRLETDHGSVSVDLSPASSLNYQVQSTSGDVACMLPVISSTTRTCVGTLGTGHGTLRIRTVSGAVILQLTP
ncbi:MAG: DUF4097 domain-containing protein [Chloroflexi bacterium]|nr:DUF4097 domain-containing protein [Chloroflexota bacterium]